MNLIDLMPDGGQSLLRHVLPLLVLLLVLCLRLLVLLLGRLDA
jgi:hypothetical protein